MQPAAGRFACRGISAVTCAHAFERSIRSSAVTPASCLAQGDPSTSAAFDQGFFPPSVGSTTPPQLPAQVVPGAQSCDALPLHAILHGVVPPQMTLQPALPPHSAVQPPSGHLIVHVLLPVHASVEPGPISTLQVLPPPQVTVLFVPVSSVHVLVPVQLEVQFDWQLPSHVDWPEQVFVQPSPQVRSQLPFASQW